MARAHEGGARVQGVFGPGQGAEPVAPAAARLKVGGVFFLVVVCGLGAGNLFFCCWGGWGGGGGFGGI